MEFPTSLMSVGKTANNSNISIFTQEDVKPYKEEEILFMCKGNFILIGRKYERDQYHISLMQT